VDLQPDIGELVWDEWNTEHIAKHDVTIDEVDQVAFGRFVALKSYKERWVLLGKVGRRILAVVVGPVPGQPRTFYCFSARAASRRERRYYLQQREGATS
jgi:uncharacterized DUF497 family protein